MNSHRSNNYAKWSVLCAVAVFSGLLMYGQTTISATGDPRNTAQFPIENGFINLGNGDVHLNIPIAGIPQRGDLSLGATLVYDSSIWEVAAGEADLQWSPTAPGGGWSIQYNLDYGATASVATHACGSDTVYVYSDIQWTDIQGTLHTFPLETTNTNGCTSGSYTNTPTAQGYAIDTSGYYASLTSYTALKIWDPKGTLVATTQVPSVGVSDEIQNDRNGNEIEYGLDGTVESDSLGHTPVVQTTVETGSDGLPSVIDLAVPVAQSHTATYTITYEEVSVSTDFGILASKFVSGESGNVAEYTGSLRVIRSIALPDGTAYTFGYDGYGLLNSVTLPKGGAVRYAYTNDSGAGTTTPPRWASSHSGSDGTTSFAYVNQGAYTPTTETGGYSCSKVTNTATGATLTQLYVFSSCEGSIQPMKLLLSPSSSPTTVDKFILYSYDFSHPCQANACTGAQWIALTGITTVLPSSGTSTSILAGTGGSGLTADVQITYGTPGSGQPTAVKQWDFRPGTYPTSLPDSPPGTAKRETDTTFGYTVNNALYPTAVITKNSSGAEVSEVDYTYDQAAYFVASPAGVPNHNNALAASPRGNATTVTHVPHGTITAPTITQHITYDDTGAVVAATDPNGNTTFVTHDSTDTFPLTITLPSTSGLSGHAVAHTTTTTHDFNTGQALSSTDQNGQVTSNEYDDIGRLSTVQFSNGGTPVTLKTITYTSATETDVSTLQVQDAYETASIPSSIIYDGYGRVVQTVRDGASSETTYNAQGLVYSVTNLHTSTPQSTDGTTYRTYDELGRVKEATLPNGHGTSFIYSLNVVTATDPLLHQRQATYDSFGNISSILEPNASNALAWNTVYTRTDWGQLTEIDQEGGSTSSSAWRSRFLTYDALNRIHTLTTQEAGTFTYGYDNEGNITSVSNQNTSANTVSYTYDALNRMLTKTVGGGPSYTYTYDAQDSSGDPYGLGRLTGSSDGNTVQARYTHDPLGRIASESDCRPSNCTFAYKISATTDFQGNIRSLTYPDGRVIEWVYDLFNRPNEEVNTFFGTNEIDVPLMVGATYFPPGQLQDVVDGSGVELTATADPDGNVTNITYNNGSNLIARSYSWSLNALDLTGITDSAAGRTQTFTYDQLDRLSTAIDSGTTSSGSNSSLPTVPASSMSYTYDAWGNLTQAGNYTFSPSVGTNNHVGCTGCTYDLAGNQTSDGLLGDTYTYRADGHQSASNGTTYSYDALDQRAVKAGTTTNEYFYFGGRVIAVRNSSTGAWTDLFYGANGLLGEVAGSADATPVYRIDDQVDTLAQTTDTNGNVIGGLSSLPFGQILSNTTSDSVIFTDHQYDSESFTDNTNFRQYSPTEGRWLAPDSYFGSYDLTNPQSFNRYQYALNSPLTLIDPLGLDYCVVSGSLSLCGTYGSPGVFSGGMGSFDGFGYTIGGGEDSITLLASNGIVPTGFYARQAFRYTGPGQDISLGNNSSPQSAQTLAGCASDFANKYSIAGGLHALGIGAHGGVGGFLTNAFGGNTISGIHDAFTKGLSVPDAAFAGTSLGIPGGKTILQKGIAGTLTDDAVAASFSSVTGAGETIQTLNTATSIASTSIEAANFADGVGEFKFAYDFVSFFVGLAVCTGDGH